VISDRLVEPTTFVQSHKHEFDLVTVQAQHTRIENGRLVAVKNPTALRTSFSR
jgi:hypothetical protein